MLSGAKFSTIKEFFCQNWTSLTEPHLGIRENLTIVYHCTVSMNDMHAVGWGEGP